jgi:hypothetical protein
MEEVLAELKYLRRDEPLGTPPLAPFDVAAPLAIDARGQAVPPSASKAAAPQPSGPPPPIERSVYVDHSDSDSSFDGSSDGDGSSAMEGSPAACPFGHGR